MPTTIPCSHCQRPLQVSDEFIGRNIRCPGRGKAFQALAEVAPAEAEPDPFDFDAQPPDPAPSAKELAKEPRRDPKPWQRVRLGVTLVLIALNVFFGSFLLAVGGLVVGALAGPRLVAFIWLGILWFLGTAIMMALGLAMVGQTFCLAAPREHGARALAATALTGSSLSLVMSIAMLVARATLAHAKDELGQAGAIQWFGNASALCSLVAFLAFLFFLRAVALCLHDRTLARSVFNFLILAGVFVLTTVTLMIRSVTGAEHHFDGELPQNVMGEAGTAFLGCAQFILMNVVAIWYVLLLMQVRQALARQIRVIQVKRGEHVR